VTTDCLEFEADLSALLDGELLPEQATRVRAHTDSCESCRARLAQLARLDSLLAGASPPAVPASLRARLEARLAAANQSGPSVGASLSARARAPRRPWRSRAAGAAAAVAAGVAFYLAIASREPAPQQGEPSPVQIARPEGASSPAVLPLAKRDTPAPERMNAPPVPSAPAAPRRERVATPPVAPEQLARRPEPAERAPEPAAALLDLESVPAEDLDLALELDTVEDLDVIANLELLELMLAAEAS